MTQIRRSRGDQTPALHDSTNVDDQSIGGRRFLLPATVEGADATLNALGQLATITEWGRAAIVHGLVLPHGKRIDPDRTSAIQRVTANQFSKRGIHGLSSPHTVQRYRDTYQAAMDAGLAEPAVLGAQIILPNVPWSEFTRPGRGDKPETDDEPDEPLDAWSAARERVCVALGKLATALDELIAAGADAERTGARFNEPPKDFRTLLRIVKPYRPIKLLPTPVAMDERYPGLQPDVCRAGGFGIHLGDVAVSSISGVSLVGGGRRG